MLAARTDIRCAGLSQALVDGWSQVGSAPHVYTASLSRLSCSGLCNVLMC